ncbi:MAG TPA: hypothetical protein IGR89_07125 [Oscillatoriaceae cyanobacterium M7585_C2015_266]|nr:hypothetical protein [Oscillatoriaceae cyanobacterium M7585_C2015_266]
MAAIAACYKQPQYINENSPKAMTENSPHTPAQTPFQSKQQLQVKAARAGIKI